MSKLSIRDIDVTNKRLFIRVDFKLPLTETVDHHPTTLPHIVATLPTIVYALKRKAKGHPGLASSGRPKGKPIPSTRCARAPVCRLRELHRQACWASL